MARGWTRRAGSRSTRSSRRRASVSPWCRSPRPRSRRTWPRLGGCSTCRTARPCSSATAMAVDHHRGWGSSQRRGPGLCRRARPRHRRERGRARQEGAERPGQDRGCDQEDAGRVHLSRPGRVSQAVRARPAARAGGVRGAVAGAGGGHGVQRAADRRRVEDQAELGGGRRERPDHQPRSRALVLRPRQEPHDRDQGCQPLGLRIAPKGGRGRDRRGRAPGR